MVQPGDYRRGTQQSPLCRQDTEAVVHAKVKVEENLIKQTAARAGLSVKSCRIVLFTTLPLSHQFLKAKDGKRHPFKETASAAYAPALQLDDFTFCRCPTSFSACKSGKSLAQKQGDMKQLFPIAVGLFLFATELSGK